MGNKSTRTRSNTVIAKKDKTNNLENQQQQQENIIKQELSFEDQEKSNKVQRNNSLKDISMKKKKKKLNSNDQYCIGCIPGASSDQLIMNSMIEDKRNLQKPQKLNNPNAHTEIGMEMSIKKQAHRASLGIASFASNEMISELSNNSTFVNRKYNQTEFDTKRKQNDTFLQRRGSYVETQYTQAYQEICGDLYSKYDEFDTTHYIHNEEQTTTQKLQIDNIYLQRMPQNTCRTNSIPDQIQLQICAYDQDNQIKNQISVLAADAVGMSQMTNDQEGASIKKVRKKSLQIDSIKKKIDFNRQNNIIC